MSMILSWALFPLVLAAVGLGWGALVEWAGGERELGALAIPLGLAAAIVVAALLTISSATAPAAAPVVAAGGGGARARLAAHQARAGGPRRGARRAADLRRAGDPQRPGDVPRLRAPRRHRDLARVHRSVLRARALARDAPDVDVQPAAADEPDHRGLPRRRVHAARRRSLDHGCRRRLDLPALPRALRGRVGDLRLGAARAGRAERLVARVRRVHRRAVCAALRLRRLGRDQGADRRIPARARPRGDGASARGAEPETPLERAAGGRQRGADRHARARRGLLRGPRGARRGRHARLAVGTHPRARSRPARRPVDGGVDGGVGAAIVADAVQLPARQRRVHLGDRGPCDGVRKPHLGAARDPARRDLDRRRLPQPPDPRAATVIRQPPAGLLRVRRSDLRARLDAVEAQRWPRPVRRGGACRRRGALGARHGSLGDGQVARDLLAGRAARRDGGRRDSLQPRADRLGDPPACCCSARSPAGCCGRTTSSTTT